MTTSRGPTAIMAAVALAACGGGDGGGEGGGDAGTTSQTIEVRTLDELRFDPSTVSVEPGETVRFVVTNPGQTDHDFILGDEAAQEEHSMHGGEHGGHGGDDGSALAVIEVAPGETEEATVTFEDAGEILYGCHEPGHYEGGMKGTVTVE